MNSEFLSISNFDKTFQIFISLIIITIKFVGTIKGNKNEAVKKNLLFRVKNLRAKKFIY
jgi:hypothetical protein